MTTTITPPTSSITVLCLEGAHGAGKTEVGKRLRELGYPFLDGAFLDVGPPGARALLHPQSFIKESAWVTKWVDRLLVMQGDGCVGGGDTGPQGPGGESYMENTVYFADRSPYSAACYAREHSELLEPVIAQQIAYLCAHAQVYVYTIYLKVDPELQWKRVQARLLCEPGRTAFREDNREWLDTVVRFYDERAAHNLWDVVIDRTHMDVDHTARAVLSCVQLLTEQV